MNVWLFNVLITQNIVLEYIIFLWAKGLMYAVKTIEWYIIEFWVLMLFIFNYNWNVLQLFKFQIDEWFVINLNFQKHKNLFHNYDIRCYRD